jgi:branched-chain amino acid transport system substrate-binding protein
MKRLASLVLAATAGALIVGGSAAARADEVKVGIIASFSGPFSVWGTAYKRAIQVYLDQIHDKIGNHTIKIIYGDDGGFNPQRAKQLAQQMVVRDGVSVLGGSNLTPNTLAVVGIVNQAKIPYVIFNTGTADVTDKSPYFVRVSPTQWANYYPLGTWAAKEAKAKRCVGIASDFAPGVDSMDAVQKGFEAAGGKLIARIMTPTSTQDFSPFIQRIRNLKPDCTFMFMPLGPQSVALMKGYAQSGLMKAGAKLLGESETWTPDLPAVGDGALGVVTAYPYVQGLQTKENKAFRDAYHAKFGDSYDYPTSVAMLAYNGMVVIGKMIEATDGKRDGQKAVDAVKGFKWNGPGGPASIDPATREITQNMHIREVVKDDKGRLINKLIYTFHDVKEPWHELNKK